MIRVLIAENQAMMRGAVALLLRLEQHIDLVAQAGAGTDVLPAARVRESRPDVALLDIEMPGATGLQAAAQLRRELPNCKVLIVTSSGRAGYVRRPMFAQ